MHSAQRNLQVLFQNFCCGKCMVQKVGEYIIWVSKHYECWMQKNSWDFKMQNKYPSKELCCKNYVAKLCLISCSKLEPVLKLEKILSTRGL